MERTRTKRPKVAAYWRVRQGVKDGVRAEAQRREMSEAETAEALLSERLAQLERQRKGK